MILCLMILLLSACQSNPDKAGGKQCGVTQGSFFGSWFDYFERGLSFADCEMWLESEQDLKKALSKRSVDKRRAYSLGMHLISDYFPHRELGVAYYYQEKYSAAKSEFEISLSQFPSAKAEEYLKRTRKHLNKDTQAPQIQLITPTRNQLVKNSKVTVSGMVSDNQFIDSLTINGVPYRYIPPFVSKAGVPVQVARKVPKMDFNLDVPVNFSHGKGLLEIIAKDISGNTTTKEIPLTIDQQGPQISIRTIEKKNQDYQLVLNVSDQQSQVKTIEINDKQIEVKSTIIFDPKTSQKVNEIHINELVSGPFDKDHILVIAVDETGNKTRAKIPLKKARIEKSTLTKQEQVPEQKLQKKIQASAPKIYLSKDQLQRETFEQYAYFEGELESDSVITALTLNGENISTISGHDTHLYFNYRLELKEGINLVTVLAENKDKQSQQKTIEIIRKLPPNRLLTERLKVAQFPFPCNVVSKSPCFVSAALYENLYENLQHRKRFQMTDKQQLDRLLDETGRCEKGISDECVIKIADHLVGKSVWDAAFPNAMFAGNVIERTNAKGQTSVEITGRMVDNQTREVMIMVDIYAENIDKENFAQFSLGMITEISDAFPLLEGNITQTAADRLYTDLTEKDRIWAQMPVLVYQNTDQKNCANGYLMDISEASSLVDLSEYDETQCHYNNTEALRVITR